MKTISIKVEDRVADAVMRMSQKELDNLAQKVELFVSNPVDELLSIMDKASEQAKKNGLTPEKLADILEIDMDEMNRTLGIEE